MNIADCARHLITYFSPEERSIPDDGTYPGRNDAVRKAMNEALQDLFSKGKPWTRRDERGAILHAPAQASLICIEGSTTALISPGEWQDWFTGCTTIIGSLQVDNQLRETRSGSPSTIQIEGSLSPDATGIVTAWGIDDAGKIVYTTGGVDPAVLTDGIVIRWTNIWTLRVKSGGTFLSGFWRSSEDVASPDLVTTWSPLIATGTPIVFSQPAAPPIEEVRLKFPWSGASGSYPATIYHDSLDLPADTLEVHEPVRLDRRPLSPMNNAYARTKGRSLEDYGFHRSEASPPVQPDGVAATAGTPSSFAVDTWAPAGQLAPGIRLRFFPAPARQGFLDYTAMLTPPAISSIESEDPLPVPFNFIESIFLPIALKKLRASPFWRGILADGEVNQGYENALSLLAEADPQRRSGVRLVPKLG